MAIFQLEAGPATSAALRVRRWRLFAGVWLLLLIEPLQEVLHQPTLLERAVGVALLVVFCVLYIFLVPQARERNAYRTELPVAMGLITAALAGMIGPAALSTFPFILVTIALLRTTALALAVTAGVTAFIVIVPQYIPSWHVTGWQWARGASVGFAGLAAVGFTRLVRSKLELREAREQVAHLAAEGERLRIARDLHDLLGHSLTTIAVKAELAQRMVDRDPARAADEMSEVAGLARQGLADVRAAVTGYREVSLATELANAREVLAAAGISAEIPHAVDAVPGELRELFGWVVREGVTNVVRHSRAQRVRINLEPRAIEIVNDGVAVETPLTGLASQNGERPAGSGHGLTGLAERAAALGAKVEADHDPDQASSFRLRVEAPAT